MPDARTRLPPLVKSLSARLLVLTVFFVMLAEVLIFAPSIARFRLVYLEERIAAAHLATLSLEATPDHMVSEELARRLLSHAEAHAIVLRGPDSSKMMLSKPPIPVADKTYDLREKSFMGLIMDAFSTLAHNENRILRVIGRSPKDPRVIVETIIDETPMRMAMYDYANRILQLSIIISLVTAALVYFSLQLLMVYPLRRMTESMTSFRRAPEDPQRIIVPSRRSDEVGVAQHQLHDMQVALRAALRQKARLAAVGTAVTKINHDLRAILATAGLVSDRLAHIDDPDARRLAPRIIESIDRAVNLCSSTLQYAKGEVPQPQRSRFVLHEMVDEIGAALPARYRERAISWENAVPIALEADADRDQIFRVLANLGTNAVEAGARKVRFSASRGDGSAGQAILIDVEDDGPGLPPKARENLFRPFAGSTRNGGTGLGLAIARELVRAHGGDLTLRDTGQNGTCFRLDIPLPRPGQ